MKRIFKRLFAIVMLAIIMVAVMCQFASAENTSDMSNDYFVKDNAGVMVYMKLISWQRMLVSFIMNIMDCEL